MTRARIAMRVGVRARVAAARVGVRAGVGAAARVAVRVAAAVVAVRVRVRAVAARRVRTRRADLRAAAAATTTTTATATAAVGHRRAGTVCRDRAVRTTDLDVTGVVLDAALHVDDKWDHAFERAERVREGFTRLVGDAGDGIALAPNTHELVVRLLSALPLRTRPRLVTTDGEFHTVRRQLDRLAEEGLEVVRVAERPVESVAQRLAHSVDDRTALVLVSAVFFGRKVQGRMPAW